MQALHMPSLVILVLMLLVVYESRKRKRNNRHMHPRPNRHVSVSMPRSMPKAVAPENPRFDARAGEAPQDAVRMEELIHDFDYGYPDPQGLHPAHIHTELCRGPWNPDHRLALVGIQGHPEEAAEVPPSNLVFLIDMSGSMGSPNKLPLFKTAFSMLIQKLRPQDTVAIVVYGRTARLLLPPTQGGAKSTINAALLNLHAGGSASGGSSAGAAGMKLAYEIARENFKKGGNNRVVLATDGRLQRGGVLRGGSREREIAVFDGPLPRTGRPGQRSKWVPLRLRGSSPSRPGHQGIPISDGATRGL